MRDGRPVQPYARHRTVPGEQFRDLVRNIIADLAGIELVRRKSRSKFGVFSNGYLFDVLQPLASALQRVQSVMDKKAKLCPLNSGQNGSSVAKKG